MKPLIKQLLRESLLKEEQLEEGYFKSFLAGLLMMTGLSWGQIKPEYKAKIDSIQKLDLSSQDKRAQIEVIVKLNRNEIKGKKDEIFIKGAVIKGFSEAIDDKAFAIGVEEEANNKNECKDFVYRKLPNGEKVSINLKKYRAYIKKHANDPEVGLDGMMDPSFTSTSCGISKAGAKQSKKDWKTK